MPQDIMKLAMSWVIKIEGGYVNDPHDAGGETNFGISKRSYPDIDIRGLTVDEAMEIYRIDYWNANRCGELPPELALFLFDSAVQHGHRKAIRFLQSAIGATVDGVIGPNTIAKAKHAAGNEYILQKAFAERTVYYHDIVINRPTQGKFLHGWVRRLFELSAFICSNDLQ